MQLGLLMKVIFIAVIGYLLGSINTSILVGKMHGIDIRKHGSGNAGTTNVMRTLGVAAALMTFLGDLLKGIIACLIGRWLMGWAIVPQGELGMKGLYVFDGEFGLMVAGLFAILGHNWPVYFKFRGGKGVLTTFAVVLMMDWKLALALLGVFVVIVTLTRYVSLGSLIAALILPFATLTPWFFHEGWMFLLITCIISFLIIMRHGGNLVRLFRGKESKLSFKKE